MNNEQLHKKAEDYGNTWIGSDIAWAAAKSGFIVGATEVLDNVMEFFENFIENCENSERLDSVQTAYFCNWAKKLKIKTNE